MSFIVHFFSGGGAVLAALGAIMAVIGVVLLIKRKKPVLQSVLLFGGLVLILLGIMMLFMLGI